LEIGFDEGDAGDPFPGTNRNTAFDRANHPNSADQAGRPSGVSVTAITIGSSTMTCDVSV
jgi:immune inhibitor A